MGLDYLNEQPGIRWPASQLSEVYTKEQAKKRWERDWLKERMKNQKYNLANPPK